MKFNVGTVDRALRIMVGLMLIAMVFAGQFALPLQTAASVGRTLWLLRL